MKTVTHFAVVLDPATGVYNLVPVSFPTDYVVEVEVVEEEVAA